MKLSEIQREPKPPYYCEECRVRLDPRQVPYHEHFGHLVLPQANAIVRKEG